MREGGGVVLVPQADILEQFGREIADAEAMGGNV